jgi:hypothetical protein
MTMPKETTAKASATKRVRRAAKPATRRRTSRPAPISHEQIALRAYELHLAGSEGDAMAHWLRAERELVGA